MWYEYLIHKTISIQRGKTILKENQITKTWTDFVKLHLKPPLKNGLTLLRRERAFVMELEGRE